MGMKGLRCFVGFGAGRGGCMVKKVDAVLATLDLSIWGFMREQSIEDGDAWGEKMGGCPGIGSQGLRMLVHGKGGMGVPWY